MFLQNQVLLCICIVKYVRINRAHVLSRKLRRKKKKQRNGDNQQ